MKIISIVHKPLFYKTTDLYTLDSKIWNYILTVHA